jgi:CheY-like chemotaxis protein
MIGYTELALSQLPGGSEIGGELQEVLSAGYRAKNLVRQILTFSRQTEQKVEPMEVGSIVAEAVKLLRSTIPATIAINFDPRAARSTILGDPTQVHQVVINLCTNAAHSMEENGGRIDIVLENHHVEPGASADWGQEAGNYLKLDVRDTGCGIAADVIDHVFEPFFTTKAKGKGTGMGLAVVHGIVESHHGHIRVDSLEGRGTVFSVYFPLVEQSSDTAAEGSGKSLEGHESILLVDDEPQIVSLLQKQLSSAGYRVSAFESSVQALNHFKSDPQKWDLVVTDMTMTTMTGEQLAGNIKAVRPEIPIILSTGYSERVSEEMIAKNQIDAILMKPVGRENLLKTLRRMLDPRARSS